MICKECKTAGDFNTVGKYHFAGAMHQKCEGDCGCHHKTGPGWFAKAGEKVKPIQTQSP
jgi:hypothetical protein